MTPRRTLILDSSARHRLRVAAVLDEHPALEIVGAVATVEDALRRGRRQAPDLIIVDADFSQEEGILVIRELQANMPDATIWVLTDRGTARGPMAREAFKLGVRAWLEKPATGVEALRDTLHAAAETLLTGTSGAPDADPEKPRRAVLPALKTVAAKDARVRASTRAPPAEPMPIEPRPRRRPARAPSFDPTPAAPRPSALPSDTAARRPAPGPPLGDPGATRSGAPAGSAQTPTRPPRPAIPPRPVPPRARQQPKAAPPAPPPPPPRPSLIVIGASTGGPEAVALLLAELPRPMDVPVIVVQHMPAFFLRRFAERLHAQGPLPTALATHDGPLTPGHVWVAPGDKHLEIRGGPGAYRAHLRGGRRLHGCRPAVDVTLISLARAGAGPTQVVVLTGMGRDGADGAKALLAHGAHVIAQDKETSVVWGMPGAVSDEGTAHAVLPISHIAPALLARLK